jgi:hypothetical protein
MEIHMSSNPLKKLYSNIVFGMTMLDKDKYWLLKRIVHKSPVFSSIKTMSFDKGSLMYGDNDIGNHSEDHTCAIINSEKMLESLNMNDYDVFHDDFIELSKMTYFIFCYVFNPFEPEKTFTDRWRTFISKTHTQQVEMSFNNSKKTIISLALALYSNKPIAGVANDLVNARKSPPIFSNCGMVFDKSGHEYKLLHYTVTKPGVNEHISVVLIENNGEKYYKVSVTAGKDNAELFRANDSGDEYFTFDFNEFTPYKEVPDFVAKFSMALVRGINPEYTEDELPNKRYKDIFDMIGY